MRDIVILLLDACRYDAITPELAPFITELSRQGTVYTGCYSGNSNTEKSMPIMWCGEDRYLTASSIPVRLKRHGYKSFLIHSNAIIKELLPPDSGWTEVIDLYPHSTKFVRDTRGKSRKIIPKFIYQFARYLYRKLLRRFSPAYIKAAKKLEQGKAYLSSSPFLVWIHLMDIHGPYSPSEIMSEKELIKINDRVTDAIHGNYSPSPEEIILWRTLYNLEVRQLDRYIQEFYNSIDWTDKTLIITADHGEEFGEHGGFGHPEDKMIEELIHVPLIIMNGERSEREKFNHRSFSDLVYLEAMRNG